MTTGGDDRFAIIMAGGEGRRLSAFVQELRQKALPKQYVSFIGRRSLLEHTIDRARKLFSPDRIFVVVSQSHLEVPEVRAQLAPLAGENVVSQPLDRGTWPGILLPLARIYAKCASATVVTFPADHFIVKEELFLAHVGFAMLKVEERPASMVLLGIAPDRPDSELGYVVPRSQRHFVSSGLLPVKEFVEKPSLERSKKLTKEGALWNTFVLVTKAKTLVHYTREFAPALHQAFLHMNESPGLSCQSSGLRDLYENMAQMDFSRGLLEKLPPRRPWSLLTLPVNGVIWSDWGSKERVLLTLDRTGHLLPMY